MLAPACAAICDALAPMRSSSPTSSIDDALYKAFLTLKPLPSCFTNEREKSSPPSGWHMKSPRIGTMLRIASLLLKPARRSLKMKTAHCVCSEESRGQTTASTRACPLLFFFTSSVMRHVSSGESSLPTRFSNSSPFLAASASNTMLFTAGSGRSRSLPGERRPCACPAIYAAQRLDAGPAAMPCRGLGNCRAPPRRRIPDATVKEFQKLVTSAASLESGPGPFLL